MDQHTEKTNLTRKNHSARLLAGALGDEGTWVELPIRRKTGIIVVMLGLFALPFSFILSWVWAISAIIVIAVGCGLTYSGVKLKDNSPWPPYGPY